MGWRSKAKKTSLFFLVGVLALQAFERESYIRAVLSYHGASTTTQALWFWPQMATFALTAMLTPWLAMKISIQNVGRIGAFLAVVIAVVMALIINLPDDKWELAVQCTGPFIGMSDGLLFSAILAGILNATTTSSSRGLTLGWVMALTMLAYLAGADEEGLLSFDSALIESAVEDRNNLLNFMMGTVSLTALLLLSMVGELEPPEQGPSDTVRRILEGQQTLRYRWWWPLVESAGVSWGCFCIASYVVIVAFLRSNFIDNFVVEYDWTEAVSHNIYFVGVVTFMVFMPLTGYIGTVLGQLKVLTAGQFLTSFPLVTLGILHRIGLHDEYGFGFLSGLFGLTSTASVGVTLAYMQESMEETYGRPEGMITSTLFLLSWLTGGLVGHLVGPVIDAQDFANSCWECAGGEVVVAIMAIVLMSLNLLTNHPREAPTSSGRYSIKNLLNEGRTKNPPYVLQLGLKPERKIKH